LGLHGPARSRLFLKNEGHEVVEGPKILGGKVIGVQDDFKPFFNGSSQLQDLERIENPFRQKVCFRPEFPRMGLQNP